MESKSALKVLNDLDLLCSDLNNLVMEYDSPSILHGKYMSEWQCPKGNSHSLWRIVHDNQYLYINCSMQKEIYHYTLDGKPVDSLKYLVYAMEIVNNQLYLMDESKFFLVDTKTNSMIQNWNLPKENNTSVGGRDLKVDQEKIYFTPFKYNSHYVYFYSKNGKEIKKFGSRGNGKNGEFNGNGEFNCPADLTVNEKYLYVCDYGNDRVQVLDKENGKFICEWKEGQRKIVRPTSILLYENLFYLGDLDGIQVFTKAGQCIQLFGRYGYNEGEFSNIRGVCIVNDKLYIVDGLNCRIQVWN